MDFTPACVEIFPPIAIARAGDSTEWYIGPEIPDYEPSPGNFRGQDGKIKKQAARFRAYAYDTNGNVQEVSHPNQSNKYTLKWTVRVANKKAAWVRFRGMALSNFGWPLVNSELGKYYEEKFQLRNASVQGYPSGSTPNYEHTETRTKLIIDSGEITLETGSSMLVGHFQGSAANAVNVSLGELRVDGSGRDKRLIVLAGDGNSWSIQSEEELYPDLLEKFDNDDWVDSMCDGFVKLEVKDKISGADIPVLHKATIIMAPPKFTSGISSFSSLYDVIEDVYEKPKRAMLGGIYDCGDVQYYRDIYPIFRSLYHMSWTNPKANEGHGPHKTQRLDDNKALSEPGADTKSVRKAIFDRVRAPVRPGDPADKYVRTKQAYEYYMPRMAGDSGDMPETFEDKKNHRDRWASLTELQYDRLSKWANGHFTTGTPPPDQPTTSIEDIPLSQQPAALTRAALQWSTGAPLYPGIETYWIVGFNHLYEYNAPFRFNSNLKPGDLTKGLSLPWQADFYMWPHTRPDSIVTKGTYEIMKAVVPHKLASNLTKRDLWDRGLKRNDSDERVGSTEMVKKWNKLGFISSVKEYPDLFIETERLPLTA